MWRRQRNVSATTRMELLKLVLLLEAVIKFESTSRFTAFFLSEEQWYFTEMTSLDRQLYLFFVVVFVVLNVEAFTLILLTTYPSPKSQFCPK